MRTITRGGKQVRPTFIFAEHPEGYSDSSIAAQMSENTRNLTEEQNATLLRIELLLKRIERRLATRMPLKRGRR